MPVTTLSPYEQTVAEHFAAACVEGKYHSRQWLRSQLSETNTTADFQAAFQTVNNYVAAKKFTNYTPTWTDVAKKLVADNLKPQREIRTDMGAQNVLDINGGDPYIPGTLPTVPEATEYQTAKFTESGKAWSTKKSGLRFHYSWEMMFSDEWNRLGRMADEMTQMAQNKNEVEAWLQYYAFGAGFNGNFFKAADNFANNPVLTLRNLEAGLNIVKSRPQPSALDGTPRVNTNTRWRLLVSSALEMTAKSILAVTEILRTDGADEYKTTPQLGNISGVTVAPWIPNIAGAGNYVQTTGWALVPEGGEGNYGTTVGLAFLAGREVPEFRMKNDQGLTMSGGALSLDAGSFDSDTSQFRIQHWVKGNTLTPDGALWSKGDASNSTTV